jgi:hypothetical protein
MSYPAPGMLTMVVVVVVVVV